MVLKLYIVDTPTLSGAKLLQSRAMASSCSMVMGGNVGVSIFFTCSLGTGVVDEGLSPIVRYNSSTFAVLMWYHLLPVFSYF